jgi:hypothetical protein
MANLKERNPGITRIFYFRNMSKILFASIYSYQANPNFSGPNGIKMGFPTNSIIIRPVNPAITFQGASCNSAIEIVSSNRPSKTYFAAETATQLISDSNN